MKASFFAVCAAALVVLVSAFAETRTSSSTIHPDSLARFEAIASYCEKADPNSGSEYLSKLAGITRGHSDDEIERDRHSARYQAAMTHANETLSKTSPGTGVRACAEFLSEKY
jgi:hypothetical protein